MNTIEGRAWHALAGTQGIGPKALWQLADYLQRIEKPASWLFQDSDRMHAAIGSASIGSMASLLGPASGHAARFEENPVTLLHPFHPSFPAAIQSLRERFPLPAILYARGNVALLSRPTVAVIGKRRAQNDELETAALLARELVRQGITVISGYAAGIDCAAHLAALRSGGTTGFVLAEGIDHFRIKTEFKDHWQAGNTLVLSQFQPAAYWTAALAMTRNRLIGALSGALVVIASGPELSEKNRSSGTFNAALAAMNMNIAVFVVVPSRFAAPPAGNSQLIAKGGRPWDPSAGIEPILAALNSPFQKDSRQRHLFPAGRPKTR